MTESDKRDRHLERLFRQSLTTKPAVAAETCLDAEAIAAWLDQGLSGAALQHAEAHISGCGRCQAVVGAVVRTAPQVAAHSEPRRRWLGWLIPLTAAAAALVVWVAVPRESAVPPEQMSARVDQARVSPPEPMATSPLIPSEVPAASPPPAPSPPQGFGSTSAPGVDTDRRVASQDETVSPRLAPRAKAVDSAAAAGVGADTAEARAEPRESAAVSGGSPIVDGVSRNSVSETAVSSAALAPAAPQIVASPDREVQWRLIGTSTIQRSGDAGRSWAPVFSDPAITLMSGSAASTTVCWFVGRAGSVVRSIDGRTFARVSFPNALHLASIRVTDALTATATTVTGQSFTTTDGGATWQER